MTKAMHCDGPSCNAWTRTQVEGWVTTAEFPLQRGCSLHFCSWDCCIKYGSLREPMTVVQLRG